MKKITQKAKNIKTKVKSHIEKVASYSRRVLIVTDYAMGEQFPTVVYALKNSAKTDLPVAKILLPATHGCSEGIGYTEFATLIKDKNGIWSKNIDIEFDKSAQKIVGVRGIIEDAQIASLDVIVIAQIEEYLTERSPALHLTKKVAA